MRLIAYLPSDVHNSDNIENVIASVIPRRDTEILRDLTSLSYRIDLSSPDDDQDMLLMFAGEKEDLSRIISISEGFLSAFNFHTVLLMPDRESASVLPVYLFKCRTSCGRHNGLDAVADELRVRLQDGGVNGASQSQETPEGGRRFVCRS